MLTQQTWRQAARAAAATGFTAVLALGAVGVAHADPGGQGTPPPHSAAASGPPGHAGSPTTPAEPAAPAAGSGHGGGHAQASKPAKPTKPDNASTPTKPTKPSHPVARGAAAGNGHTPVTVCHALGNGGYHLLTFDDNALDAHLRHGDLYPVPADGCPSAAATEEPPAGVPAKPERGNARVTVCHALGNGGYHLLTFDDNALDAHLRHGDLYPVPADGCPGASSDEETPAVPGSTPEAGPPTASAPGLPLPEVTVPGAPTPAADTGTVPVVAGVEQHAASSTTVVRGVEQTATGSPTAARVAPVAGVLPQTGAGRYAPLLALGAGLVGGGVLLARRRAVSS